jgi:hypothetical protein
VHVARQPREVARRAAEIALEQRDPLARRKLGGPIRVEHA